MPVGKARGKSIRTLLGALFAIYLVLLVWVVLWKLEIPHLGGNGPRSVKLIPFVAAGADGASAPLEVLANLLLFVPLGVYPALLSPAWGWRRIVWLAAGISLAFECAQLALALGAFDVTDVIVNTCGALLGFALLGSPLRRSGRDAVERAVRWCALGSCLALLAAGALALSPSHYAQQDAGPLATRAQR